jgi:sulfur carrier protein
MNIVINGVPTDVEDSIGMSTLILHLGLAGQRVAVEVNEELIPRSRFDVHVVQPGDRVEIIHAVGGG